MIQRHYARKSKEKYKELRREENGFLNEKIDFTLKNSAVRLRNESHKRKLENIIS